MRLALSTAAAPDFTLAELFDACERRGLAALELIDGHRHGIGPESSAPVLEALGAEVEGRGIRIAALRLRSLHDAATPEAARLAAALGAPVVVSLDGARDQAGEILTAARRYAREGARLLLAHGSNQDDVRALLRTIELAEPGVIGLAWDAAPGDDLALAVQDVLPLAAEHLHHIRLLGGGPEAGQNHGGAGIGPLMGALALAGYDGAVAVAPSNPRFHYVWKSWLGRGRGGWGCGSKHDVEPPVALQVGDEQPAGL